VKKELKLTKQMKIALGAGGVVIVSLLAFVVLGGSHSAKPSYTAAPVAPAPTTTTPTKGPQKIQLNPGLPGALRKALLAHDVVIAVVYGQGQSASLTAARQGAKTAHAGFAALDVGEESIARDVAVLVPGIPSPTVLVVRRPGTVTATFPGYSDSDTLAQAAVDPATTTTAAPTPAPAPSTP